MKKSHIIVPQGLREVLLHACCAPCSSAIVEWLMNHDIRPVIFYYNPNIFPQEEYLIRKNESKRHADSLGIEWIDGDYNHEAWLAQVSGLEQEPERGHRCDVCFYHRLLVSARKAKELGMRFFTTTLCSSRWKSIEQITNAGLKAQTEVPGTVFWAQNWRKDGLYERRNQLLKEYSFYNQQYCGCEYSMRRNTAHDDNASTTLHCQVDPPKDTCASHLL
ncbi:MAG: epoxyqueuosine reductase QueH [Prevotella sp.]|nr:epoxyqueuosine reductase QueH [Prevotella sp.]